MAITELLKRLEKWRRENGRDPITGSKRIKRSRYDDISLMIIALKSASNYGRTDLRPHYERLCGELETFRQDRHKPNRDCIETKLRSAIIARCMCNTIGLRVPGICPWCELLNDLGIKKIETGA